MPRNKRKPRIPINERIKKIKNPKILDLFNEMQSSIHEREKRLNMCPGEQETNGEVAVLLGGGQEVCQLPK